MTAEERLKLLLNADRAPARDLAFEVAVAERIARRRAVLSVAALTPLTAAAAGALWVCRDAVEPLAAADWSAVIPVTAAACIGAVTAFAALRASRRLEA